MLHSKRDYQDDKFDVGSSPEGSFSSMQTRLLLCQRLFRLSPSSKRTSPGGKTLVMRTREPCLHKSFRLWSKVTEAIKRNDQDAATDAKSAIEDKQRELAKQREASGEKWAPKYFSLNKRDEHRPVFS